MRGCRLSPCGAVAAQRLLRRAPDVVGAFVACRGGWQGQAAAGLRQTDLGPGDMPLLRPPAMKNERQAGAQLRGRALTSPLCA